MTTEHSPIITYKDEDPDPEAVPAFRTYKGQLSVSHTSDTVSWSVDQKQRWVMSKPEFGALVDALDGFRDYDVQSQAVQLLKKIERQLTDSPAFNRWDLGASRLLTEVRDFFQKVGKTAYGPCVCGCSHAEHMEPYMLCKNSVRCHCDAYHEKRS